MSAVRHHSLVHTYPGRARQPRAAQAFGDRDQGGREYDTFQREQRTARRNELQGLRLAQEQSRTARRTLAALPRLALAQLDAYVLARAVDGRPLDTAECIALAKAQRVTSETRTTLVHGRINVSDDMDGAGYIRGLIYACLRTAMPDRSTLQEAVWATMLRSSVCNGFAGVAALQYLRVAEPDETIVVCMGNEHNWLQIRRPGKATIIIDPWSESPAHYLEDSALPPKPKVRIALDKSSEKSTLEEVDRLTHQFEEMYNTWFLASVHEVRKFAHFSNDALCCPTRRKGERMADLVARHVSKIRALDAGLRYGTVSRRSTTHDDFSSRVARRLRADNERAPFTRDLLARTHSLSRAVGDSHTLSRAWTIAERLNSVPHPVEFYERS